MDSSTFKNKKGAGNNDNFHLLHIYFVLEHLLDSLHLLSCKSRQALLSTEKILKIIKFIEPVIIESNLLGNYEYENGLKHAKYLK